MKQKAFNLKKKNGVCFDPHKFYEYVFHDMCKNI